VELFSRAYGINGFAKEHYADLQREAKEKYDCSPLAFQALIIGHSYNDLLGETRMLIPGYPSKEEANAMKKRQALRSKPSRSVGSSPVSTLRSLRPNTPHTSRFTDTASNTPIPRDMPKSQAIPSKLPEIASLLTIKLIPDSPRKASSDEPTTGQALSERETQPKESDSDNGTCQQAETELVAKLAAPASAPAPEPEPLQYDTSDQPPEGTASAVYVAGALISVCCVAASLF
jgi:hypothetical protein